MIPAILEIIAELVKLGLIKEERKYIDKLTELETQYRAEYNQPYLIRNHALLDSLEFEMRQLIRNIASDLAATNPVVPRG